MRVARSAKGKRSVLVTKTTRTGSNPVNGTGVVGGERDLVTKTTRRGSKPVNGTGVVGRQCRRAQGSAAGQAIPALVTNTPRPDSKPVNGTLVVGRDTRSGYQHAPTGQQTGERNRDAARGHPWSLTPAAGANDMINATQSLMGACC